MSEIDEGEIGTLDAFGEHVAEVLFGPIDEWDGDFPSMHRALAECCAWALQNDPLLREILDLAGRLIVNIDAAGSDGVRELLADWQVSRDR